MSGQVPPTLSPLTQAGLGQISGEPGGNKGLLGTPLMAGGGRDSHRPGLSFTACATRFQALHSHTTSTKLKADYFTFPCL